MLEQLETKVVEMLPDLQQALQTGLEYGGDLFERFIQYMIMVNSLIVITWILITIIIVFAVKPAYFFVKKNDDGCGSIAIPAIMLSLAMVVFYILFCIFAGECALEIIKAIYLPEVLVIDYFK